MKTPDPIWTADYQHDRRAHRHRCRCCNRILDAGDRVLFCRYSHKGCYVIHIACADKQHGTADWTWRDAMAAWGNDYLRKLGYRIAA
jgi:hypothetical protein